MKVLIIHNFYQSKTIGGEDLVVDREFRGLQKALGEENVFQYYVYNDDIRPLKLLRSIWGDKTHARAVYDLIKVHGIELVHVHNFFPLLTPSIFIAAKAAGAKVVHTLHNYRNWCLSGLFYREDKAWCLDCANKSFMWPGVLNGCYRQSKSQSSVAAGAFSWYKKNAYLDDVDSFFALTSFQKNLLIKLGLPENKITIKPNGIDTQQISSSTNRLGYLYVGRLEAAKGFNNLLNLWKDLDFPLWIIGENKDNYSNYQHPKVTFLGQLPHVKVLKWMSQVKYLIHPGEAVETFGLNMIEAMAMGTPIIGLNRGTRVEFIESESNGFRCEPEFLKQTIEKAESYVNYNTLSENAKKFAGQFAIDLIIKEQISCYHQIKSA